ncbi:MAG: trypsin-like peptidase domain-containing protein [Enterocloster asparagiformis]|nr:trypsin-like peptidase domain-containing protein [Enterocloster asparagiformis]
MYENGQQYENGTNYSQGPQQGPGSYNSAEVQASGGPSRPPRRKKGSAVKKAAGLIAGAVLFGGVSGATMVGVNMAAAHLLPQTVSAPLGTPEQEAPKTQESQAPAQSGGNEQNIQTPSGRYYGNGGGSYNGGGVDVSSIVEEAMPSVVAITSVMEYQSNDPYSWFFGGGGTQTYEVPSSGSGIIVGENDKELLIVTNNHVVADSKELKVAFIDDEVVEAVVKGTDSDSDLAVIAVPLENIPQETRNQVRVAKLGDSDALKVGQGVIAIGNALGYGQSVTVGYVSALNREVRTSENNTRTLLQTDAAINPGNSGGALVNMKGEVIGINAAKYASTEVEGIGYAIPISKAEGIIGDLMSKKTQTQVAEEKRGYLGIQGISVDTDTAKALGMPEGVYVYKILEDGAAAGSDLYEKDIITKFDGQSVKTMADLQEVLASYEVGEQVDLTVQSLQNGQYVEHKVTVTLAPMPADEQ